MRMGFCLSHSKRGVQCGTVSTENSTEMSAYRTYWFPTDYKVIDKIKDNNPLDLWDATHDSYKISGYSYGLDQFKLSMSSSSSLVGQKWQHKKLTDSSQWANVKDYRWSAGDEIGVYRME